MPTINEERLCEAVIRRFEDALSAKRADVTYPEKTHIGPPVDMRLAIGDTRLAIEHTIIEPFAQAIETGKEFEELVRPILDTIGSNLPKPGTYHLHFPLHPTAGRHRKTHPTLRAKIIDWIKNAAAELHAEYPERLDRWRSPRGYEGQREAEIDGLPITLKRVVGWSENGRHDGALFPYRIVGDDVEESRLARIGIALDKKLPKLEACHDQGDATVLILEYADVALTNQVLVAQALAAALTGRDFCPDHIFLADTTSDRQWYLFQPVEERVFDLETEYIEVPGELLPGAAG